MSDMFEKAVRLKIRYNFKGLSTVEDLWDLSLEELNMIFQGLNSQLKEYKEESLLDKKTKEEEVLELTVNIVKHIFETKQQEQKERGKATIKAVLKQRLLGKLANKQDQKYDDMTEEELTKIIDKWDVNNDI